MTEVVSVVRRRLNGGGMKIFASLQLHVTGEDPDPTFSGYSEAIALILSLTAYLFIPPPPFSRRRTTLTTSIIYDGPPSPSRSASLRLRCVVL
ncbi:hypothetical protein SESBI_21190 [Sesbania bispinosa]|nr:hypothetical protein SESBI_21190 [Sesbania bispinosa]